MTVAYAVLQSFALLMLSFVVAAAAVIVAASTPYKTTTFASFLQIATMMSLQRHHHYQGGTEDEGIKGGANFLWLLMLTQRKTIYFPSTKTDFFAKGGQGWHGTTLPPPPEYATDLHQQHQRDNKTT